MAGASVPVPRERRTEGRTVEFTIDGSPGVMTTGHAADGALRRVDLRAGVHGSELAGLADALATAITIGLQHGAPSVAYAAALAHLEPGAALAEALEGADPRR